jgi:hypothetical protein
MIDRGLTAPVREASISGLIIGATADAAGD